MMNNDSERINRFNFIKESSVLKNLLITDAAAYENTLYACATVINVFKPALKVTVDNIYVQFEYYEGEHTYGILINLRTSLATSVRDSEFIVADVELYTAITSLEGCIELAAYPVIAYPSVTAGYTETFSSPTEVQTQPATSVPTPKKKIRISITYAREVSVSDSSFSAVMSQVSQLCESQPKALSAGFVLTDTNIAIAED